MIDVSLIIACYNEEKLLEESIREVEFILNNSKFTYELIIIDDQSRDKTRDVIQKIARGKKNIRTIFHNINMGRGKTVTDGFRIAKGEVVGYLDIDLEVSPVYIPYFVARIINGHTDVVTGWRVYRENIFSLHRAILSRGYSWLVRKMLGITLNDTETGYKFFGRKKILPVLEKIRHAGWFWDTEIMTYAYYKKLRIEEIPVLFIRRFDKQSSVNIVKDTYEYMTNLFSFRQTLKRQKLLV